MMTEQRDRSGLIAACKIKGELQRMKLIEDYKILHQADAFGGMTLAKFADAVIPLLEFHNAKSVLDYGSGKGQAWERHGELAKIRENLHVILYDPGVPEHANKPSGTFAAVLCVDVVEHVPEDEIPAMLREVFSYANKIVIASFCPRGSKKKLPSTGADVHVTQKPREYWERKFSDANATRSHPIPWYLFENP